MTEPIVPRQSVTRRSRSRGGAVLILAVGLLVAPAVSGCAGDARTDPARTAQPVAATPASRMGPGSGDPSMHAAWESRPAYVRANARTEAAYAYALEASDVLRWMPCYCGCGAMGHGSNADCFFKPTMAGLSSLTFEEHASYCGICVDTALMVQQLTAEGQSLQAIRAAVDARFGGAAPGTPTDLPPA